MRVVGFIGADVLGANSKTMNPISGNEVFGSVPSLTLPRRGKPSIIALTAPIHLKEGKHFGPNAGYGVEHIWAEHQSEIEAAGFNTVLDVPAYVIAILRTPTLLYFEDRPIPKARVNAVRIVTGTVILEYVQTQVENVLMPHWSIVTAYSGTRTAGVLVGNI